MCAMRAAPSPDVVLVTVPELTAASLEISPSTILISPVLFSELTAGSVLGICDSVVSRGEFLSFGLPV